MEGRGFELVTHNIANDPPSRELLGRLIDERGTAAVLNPRSPAYKERGLADRKLTKKEAIDLILEDPNLMRRPLLLGEKGKALMGYDAAEYEKL